MSSDPKQVILIVIPVAVLSIAIITTFIVILVKMRRRSQREILPTTQKPMSAIHPPTFTGRHLANLRSWQKAANSASTNSAWPTIKVDPGHQPFLAQPLAAHQPQRTAKGSWEMFKEKQQQRALANEKAQPVGKWHHRPKGPAYWREIGEEMEARKPWWEKAKDQIGL